MPLPKKEKLDPRPVAVTVRLSRRSVEALKAMAAANNLSQADVIEHLIRQEWALQKRTR